MRVLVCCCCRLPGTWYAAVLLYPTSNPTLQLLMQNRSTYAVPIHCTGLHFCHTFPRKCFSNSRGLSAAGYRCRPAQSWLTRPDAPCIGGREHVIPFEEQPARRTQTPNLIAPHMRHSRQRYDAFAAGSSYIGPSKAERGFCHSSSEKVRWVSHLVGVGRYFASAKSSFQLCPSQQST